MVWIRVGRPGRRRRLARPPLRGWGRAGRPAVPVFSPPVHGHEQPGPPEAVEEFDSPEDVEALFHAQHRLGLGVGVAFLALTLAVPVLSIFWRPWYEVQPGRISPNFAAVVFLLPAATVGLGFVFRRRADAHEERFLGREEGGGS